MSTSAEAIVPTAEHHDLVAAKRGDASARYRVMMRRRQDPERHRAACAELTAALRERWSQRPGESARAHIERTGPEIAAWNALAEDDLVPVKPF